MKVFENKISDAMSTKEANNLLTFLPYSVEQSTATASISRNKGSVIQYLDKYMLCETVVFSIIENLHSGKRSFIVIESEDLGDLIVQMLSKFQAGPYILRLKNDDFLSEQSISTIRTHYKNTKAFHDSTYKNLLNKHASNDKKIRSAYDSLTKKVFGERRWIDLALIRERTDKIFHTSLEEIELQLTQQEFWHLRGRIEEAKSVYSYKTYMNESLLSRFNISIENDKKFLLLKETLIRFKIKMEQIIHDLEVEIERYRKKVHDQLYVEYLEASHYVDEVNDWIADHQQVQKKENKSGIFSFAASSDENLRKKYLQWRKLLEKNILLELEEIDPSTITRESILSEMIVIYNQLEDWQTKSEQITIRMVKSLNKNNSDSDQLKNIDQFINILFSEIHESGIFREVFENTGMSTYNQYNQLQKILKNIKVLLSYIRESRDIVMWESFYNQQSSAFKQVIDILKRHDPRDWIPLFEKWYLDKLLRKYDHPYTLILEDLLAKQKDISHELNEAFNEKIEEMFLPGRVKSTDKCRLNNKNIYQNLFKKRNPDNVRAFDMIWDQKEMLSWYFPVMIVSGRLLKSNRLLKDGNWDQLYVEGTEIFQFVEKYTILERKTCFFTPLAESFKVCNDTGIKLDDRSKSVKVLLHQYRYEKKINELPVSERLKAAKILAKMLLSLQPPIRIFQIKQYSIISLVNAGLAEQLWKLYQNEGIKEIDTSEQIYESITESILDSDSQKVLLYQDHLLHSDMYPCYLWQMKVISHLEEAGYLLFNVSTKNVREQIQWFELKLKENIVMTNPKNEKVTQEA
ncbi:MAG TPA: hypothetical protein PKC30_11750 [Saprospiraceae bacterium]|nr:hypothetical protein [Saprospiraceae bacterium]